MFPHLLLVQGQFVVGLGWSSGRGSGKECFVMFAAGRSDGLVSFVQSQWWPFARSSTWRDHRDPQ